MTAQIKMTRKEAEVQMACFRQTFSSVRLLNEKAVLHAPQAHSKRTELECRVLHEKRQLTTLDVTPQRAEQIFARYVEVDGEPCVLELVQDLQQDTPEAVVQRRQMLTQTGSMGEKLYRDALTGLYNRRYYEDALKNRGMEAGVAVLDMDGFKACNETYGHQAGDKMLEAAVGVMRHCVRRSDTIIRYGGDEFLLLLPHIEEATFQQKLQDICCQISETRLPGLEDIRLSVSIGGLINRGEPIDCAVERANQLMMQAKKSRNAVVTDSEIAAEDIAPRKDTRPRMKILIVDDSRTNRAILNGLIPDRYDVLEAADGLEGLDMLRRYGTEIALVLLDLLMPTLSGFDMLSLMAANQWLEEIPVVMISSENDADTIHRAYDLGVSDYITRPFDADVVSQRISNTIKLYARQRGLSNQVRDQIHEKERSNRLMLEIISEVVSARNGESGAHMRHLCLLTEVLLDTLVSKTKRYTLTPHERKVIVTASAFHDIGKMGIDEKILNKSGQLTEEEYIVMKSHTLIGASMLARLDHYRDEELARTAYQICRWHHERYDGGGYPDGLKGEEIPIAAQVVSIADAYDALISPRVYKEGFSHEQAMQMIRNGECGAFNPLLMLFSLMTIVAGFRRMGALDAVSRKLTRRVTTLRGLSAVMVALCFVLSMLVTNDVALLTLVPLTLLLFRAGGQKSTIWTVVLETVAANLGSMVTPIGNPQNLYLYTSGRLTALDFLTLLAPYAAVALALLLALCLLLPKERVAVDASARAPLARKMLTLYGALSALALLAIAKVLPAWALAAAVFLGTLALDRGTIRQVDYTLLATFVCFFVFVASVKACVPVRAWLETMMARSPMAVALLTSQVISNVPACLLLSPFTQDAKALALGVDLGGLGTLIASLASLISFRLYGAGEGARKGRYFAVFTGVNVLFLAVMLGLAAIL